VWNVSTDTVTLSTSVVAINSQTQKNDKVCFIAAFVRQHPAAVYAMIHHG
jgi:hypothetical protein